MVAVVIFVLHGQIAASAAAGQEDAKHAGAKDRAIDPAALEFASPELEKEFGMLWNFVTEAAPGENGWEIEPLRYLKNQNSYLASWKRRIPAPPEYQPRVLPHEEPNHRFTIRLEPGLNTKKIQHVSMGARYLPPVNGWTVIIFRDVNRQAGDEVVRYRRAVFGSNQNFDNISLPVMGVRVRHKPERSHLEYTLKASLADEHVVANEEGSLANAESFRDYHLSIVDKVEAAVRRRVEHGAPEALGAIDWELTEKGGSAPMEVPRLEPGEMPSEKVKQVLLDKALAELADRRELIRENADRWHELLQLSAPFLFPPE